MSDCDKRKLIFNGFWRAFVISAWSWKILMTRHEILMTDLYILKTQMYPLFIFQQNI